MGGSHELRDFMSANSGFRVVSITLEDDGGYEIETSNREEVPDYIPELVEQSIRDARESVASVVL